MLLYTIYVVSNTVIGLLEYVNDDITSSCRYCVGFTPDMVDIDENVP